MAEALDFLVQVGILVASVLVSSAALGVWSRFRDVARTIQSNSIRITRLEKNFRVLLFVLSKVFPEFAMKWDDMAKAHEMPLMDEV